MKALFTLIFSAVSIISCVAGPQNADRSPAQTQSDFGPRVETRINGLEGFTSFGGLNNTEKEVKYILLNMGGREGTELFLDPSFYNFHDDWYLYRSFTGQTVPGMNEPPMGQLQVNSPVELQTALKRLPALPQGLKNVGGRIIGGRFYEASGNNGRYGLGSVVYSYKSGRAQPQIVAFTMVFNDSPTEAQVKEYRERLGRALNLTAKLKWLPRSQAQEQLADRLAQKAEWQPYLVRFQDLVVPGEMQVYSSGASAGRLRYFAKGQYDPTQLTPEDIVLLEELPDDLPPVRGILTNVPQSPLAHVNLLARGRGTLNAFISDPALFNELKTKAASRQAIAVRANEHSSVLNYFDMPAEDYRKFQSLFTPRAQRLPDFDFSRLEYVYDLNQIKNQDRNKTLRSAGGKSFGMTRLLKTEGILVPPRPLAISTRAYREHLSKTFGSSLQQALSDSKFKSDSRVRFLVLEGKKAFEKQFPGNPLPEIGGPLTAIVAKGGVKQMFEDQPMDDALERTILAKLKEAYPSVPRGQPIRFRSSSDVEDIPGFVGAGLHESYSGYLDPATQARQYPNDPEKTRKELKKTAARAIQRTWSSYWNYRAFEERQLSGIDHLSGSMAVMVHPGFPETVELGNGVLTIKRSNDPFMGVQYQMTVNANPEEESVVRPDGSIVEPQRITISKFGNSEPFITGNLPTSRGIHVLSGAQINDLFSMAIKVVNVWVDLENKALAPDNRFQEYTLDMEFKIVPENWPRSLAATGAPVLLLKQSRPLMRLTQLPNELASLPAPRDFLNEATRILKRNIKSAAVDFETVEIYKKDTAHDGAFNVYVKFDFKQPLSRFRAGQTLNIPHTKLVSPNHGFMHHGPWDLSFSVASDITDARAADLSFSTMEHGGMNFDFPNEERIEIAGERVKVTDLLISPQQWANNYVDKRMPPPPPSMGGGVGIGIGIRGGQGR